MPSSPATVAVVADRVSQRQSASAVAMFTATTFIGSGLLFLVQPIVAKLLLPRLGGSPAVWNTCVLFFQTMLLVGYLYAHVSTRWLGVHRQVLWHIGLVLAVIVFLPLAVGTDEPSAAADPVWWLLRTMTLRIGVPFFVVSASAPLLQRWFASLPTASARDPYFLYAASNCGSMLALLAFPLLLEPTVGARYQTWLWTGGYVVLAAATAGCGLYVRSFPEHVRLTDLRDEDDAEPITVATRWTWTLLSFVPASLMLGVTTHISTDVAAVPLLWIPPLALYLGTFVLAFASRQLFSERWFVRLQPALVTACLLSTLINAQRWWLIPLHLATFFVCAMICHRELAKRRPAVRHLTEFYIWISVGGMCGGIFATLVAPHLFTKILEYPLVLAIAASIRPSPRFRDGRKEPLAVVLWLPLGILLASTGVWWAGWLSPATSLFGILVGFGSLAAIASMFANRPQPFGILALAFVALIARGEPARSGTVLFAGRSFFGVHRVSEAPDHSYHLLQHGSTNHGRQDTATMAGCEPTGYYHRAGPIGQLFASGAERFADVAVVGLGSGALACYARPGQRWTFYEIDPMVERIAREPRYFTYLQHGAGNVAVTLGDGRLNLRRASSGAYDLIVLDAFSSDAIPVHLLTREAIALYVSRLRRDGVIAFHISNRYLNLEPVLTAIAREEGLVAAANLDIRVPDADVRTGRWPSFWVAAARTRGPLEGLRTSAGWREPAGSVRVSAWTDDYSNLVQILQPR